MTLEFITKKALTKTAVLEIMGAAAREAEKNGVRVCICVLDEGGHLLELSRMDRVHAGTVDVSIAKARSAIMFRGPTSKFAGALNGGLPAIMSLPGMLPLPGGIPFIVDDFLIGAIGVSGASPDVDERIAAAGAALLDGET